MILRSFFGSVFWFFNQENDYDFYDDMCVLEICSQICSTFDDAYSLQFISFVSKWNQIKYLISCEMSTLLKNVDCPANQTIKM